VKGRPMQRRQFITLLGTSAAAWPLAARAQPRERVQRIAMFNNFFDGDAEGQVRISAFQRGLAQLGWITGRNVRFEHRWPGTDPGRIQAVAKEVVETPPDVIVAGTTPHVAALMRETRAIPIVFATLSDPVGSGFIASLARPGGNVTRFINVEASIAGKWVEMLKEFAPSVTRVLLPHNPDTAPFEFYLPPLQTAARAFSVATFPAPVRTAAELEAAIVAHGREPGGGVIVTPDSFTGLHRELITALASRYRLPVVGAFRFIPAAGSLASYGVDQIDLFRRAAAYVDRIFKGENPADLPVQLPTKFELVINGKTAKQLGLTVPPIYLAIADEVIE
jgi:ABC-type uncharacterized transport system substrate-binding protein